MNKLPNQFESWNNNEPEVVAVALGDNTKDKQEL